MLNVVMVVDAVVDTKFLRLYLEDGTTMEILQGDPRLTLIAEQITPIILAGMIAKVNLSPLPEPNPYKEYEDQSGSVVTFFKTAVNAMKDLFGYANEPRPTILVPLISVTAVERSPAALQRAVREIIEKAQPAFTENITNLNAEPDKEEQTVVAVVGENAVVGVTAMNAFMERAANVASERKYSTDDLLEFLKKANIPIADDGCIVIYKSLIRVYVKQGQYMDVHSRRVYQDISDYVCLDAKLIDHNRNVECSNGMYVGSRGYMDAFGRDVVVLAKVAPEDVIEVPHGDLNKLRIRGYHILFELSENAKAALIQNNQAFTDNAEHRILLDRALSGDHSSKKREVRICAPNGYGLVYTSLSETDRLATPKWAPAETITLQPESTITYKAAPVYPKKIVEKVTAVKFTQPARKPTIYKFETRAEKMRSLYYAFLVAPDAATKNATSNAVWMFKQKTKQSFLELGLTYAEIAALPPRNVKPLPKG